MMEKSDLKTLCPDMLSPGEIEEKAEAIGLTKANTTFGKAFILSIMAGAFIACGGMFMLIVKADATLPFAVSQVLGGLTFCLGLFLVVVAGAELFTGNCLMIAGKLSKKFSWAKMFKSWVIVYVGNFVGSLVMVVILFYAHFWALGGGEVGNAMISVAAAKINQTWDVLLFKGIMCNFLVCLAVWMAYAARTLVDKFFAILLPITAFVACGFEHCVANMFLLPMGWTLTLSGFEYGGSADIAVVNPEGILMNIGVVTLGNIIGGMVMVGVSYWLAYHKR